MHLRGRDTGIETIAGQGRLRIIAHSLLGEFLMGVKDSQRETHTKPLLHYTIFMYCVHVCVRVGVGSHVPQSICQGQRTTSRSWLLLSALFCGRVSFVIFYFTM